MYVTVVLLHERGPARIGPAIPRGHICIQIDPAVPIFRFTIDLLTTDIFDSCLWNNVRRFVSFAFYLSVLFKGESRCVSIEDDMFLTSQFYSGCKGLVEFICRNFMCLAKSQLSVSSQTCIASCIYSAFFFSTLPASLIIFCL